jgi:hypothetical protein
MSNLFLYLIGFKSSNKLKEIADINNFTSDEILAMKDRYGYSKAKKEGKMNPLPSLKDVKYFIILGFH